MRVFQFVIPALLFLAASAHADVVNFSGVFQHDDELAVFHYSVQHDAPVTVATTSYANGGFIPILSLFDSTGNFLYWSDGYSLNSDASFTLPAIAFANYTVVLSEWDNYPNGNLADGFKEAGNGDFTTALTGFPGPFANPSGGPAFTGNWAVTFSSAEPLLVTTTAVPEPGSAVLLLTGALLIGLRARRRSSPNN